MALSAMANVFMQHNDEFCRYLIFQRIQRMVLSTTHLLVRFWGRRNTCYCPWLSFLQTGFVLWPITFCKSAINWCYNFRTCLVCGLVTTRWQTTCWDWRYIESDHNNIPLLTPSFSNKIGPNPCNTHIGNSPTIVLLFLCVLCAYFKFRFCLSICSSTCTCSLVHRIEIQWSTYQPTSVFACVTQMISSRLLTWMKIKINLVVHKHCYSSFFHADPHNCGLLPHCFNEDIHIDGYKR